MEEGSILSIYRRKCSKRKIYSRVSIKKLYEFVLPNSGFAQGRKEGPQEKA